MIREILASLVKSDAIQTGTIDAKAGNSNVQVTTIIDMQGNAVQNVLDPVSAQDAATKNYVDDADSSNADAISSEASRAEAAEALLLPLAGGTLSGNLDMGTHSITNLSEPGSDSDAATKGYADAGDATNASAISANASAISSEVSRAEAAEALLLPLAGGTMSGDIDMGANAISDLADPSAAQDAATKNYVDTSIASIPSADLTPYVKHDGTVAMTGDLDLGSNSIVNVVDPTSDQDAATKHYVDAGDATNASAISAEASARATAVSTEASARAAADALLLPLAGGTMSGAIDMGSNAITDLATPSNDNDAANKAYVDTQLAAVAETIDFTPYVKHDGSVAMTGNLDLGTHQINNVVDPTADQDAATKKYVDDGLALKIDSTLLGVANGVAQLDSAGKIPLAQMPASIVEYKGVYDATTNSPTLVDGTGTSGWFYRVTVAGTQDFGGGAQTFAVGDWVVYDGAKWDLAHAGSDLIASVNGYTGVVVLAANDIGYTNSTSGLTATNVQTAIDEVAADALYADGSKAMTGDLDLGSHAIVNVSAPSDDNDAANKGYVDSAVSTAVGAIDLTPYFKKDGSVVATGDFDMGQNAISNASSLKATKSGDATTNIEMNIAGGVAPNLHMTVGGTNVMGVSFDPTQGTSGRGLVAFDGVGMFLTAFEDVMSLGAGLDPNSATLKIDSGNALVTLNSAGLKINGGALEVDGTGHQIAKFLQSAEDSTEVFIGSSLTSGGNLVLGFNTADDYGYLQIFGVAPGASLVIGSDGKVGIGTTSLSHMLEVNGSVGINGALEMNSNLISDVTDPVSAQDAATKAYVDAGDSTEASARAAADALLLPLAGGTMSGAINMGTFAITNMSEPSSGADAATKNYVDTAISTVSGEIDFTPYLKKDGTVAMTAAFDAGGFAMSNLADPSLDQDAATKFYVDSAASALQTNIDNEANARDAADGVETSRAEAAEAALAALVSAAPVWQKFTVPYTDLQAGSSGFMTLDAKQVIHGVVVKHSVAFSAPAASAITVSVGVSGSADKYSSAFDIKQAVGSSTAQVSQDLAPEDFVSSTQIVATLGIVGDVDSNLTAGSLDIWVSVSTLP